MFGEKQEFGRWGLLLPFPSLGYICQNGRQALDEELVDWILVQFGET